MSLQRIALATVLLSAGWGSAQTYLATTTNNVTYPALSAPTTLALQPVFTGSNPVDQGRVTLPLGFTFPYFNRAYTQVTVSSDGLIHFEPYTSVLSLNRPIPYAGTPQAVIAPLWDDLAGTNPLSRLRSEALTGPDGAGIAIEWSEWNHFHATSFYSLTFQVRLWENGLIELYYGPLTGAGQLLSASAGIEDPLGTTGVPANLCTNPNANCVLADFPSNRLIRFGPPVPPDLQPVSLGVDSITAAGTDLQVTTRLRLRNWGQTATGPFTYQLYLSTNTLYEPGVDLPFNPAAQGPLTLGPLAILTHVATSTVPRPPTGAYYVLAVLDEANAVSESVETNNLSVTSTTFLTGVDLIAQAVSGPVGGGPGEQVVNHLVFSNRGIDAPGVPVDYKVWLSSDVLWSATDYLVHQGSMTLTGGQTVDTDVSYNLPGSVPTGNYYFLLQLDDGPSAGAIFEAAEGNNVVASPTTFNARQADLSVDPVLVLDPTPPHGPAEAAFFGENVRLDVTVANVGGATATNFEVAFYLSENETLNAFNDPFIGDVRNLTLGPGATMVVSLTAPVPSTTAGGASLVPGDFSFFAAATAVGLSETSTFNNINRSSPTKVRGPAPDLIATALAGPSRVGAGELMVVSRTVRNSGNRDAGPAAYRYFLSANSIITLDDVPLHVVTAAGESTGGTVTLGVGEQDSATDVVRVPSGTPFATYYLGVLVDPAEPGGSGAVLEISEANNALASQTVEVVAQALRVTNPSLPDAVLGLPYDYRLAAAGGDGTYSFALKPNAGDLPAGLTLDASGLLHGTPSASTTAVFSVVVTSGQKSVEARLVLRVVPLTASLTITTRQLPPAVRLVAYEHFLSAQGGIGPYTWSLESGRLPTGLVLSESGALSGVPSDVIGTTADFSLRVRDRAGNSEVRAYTLAVVDASSFLIKTLVLPPGNVGSEYLIDVAAQNADSSPVSQPIEWAVVGGGLPQGLLLEPTDEVLLIRGVPTRAGNFPFTLQVSDGKGRSDVADFVLVVYSSSAQVTGTVPEQLYRGQEVSAALSLAGAQASFGLYSGRLPLGLSLSSEGVVGGTVAEEAQLGVYNFTVLATSVDGSRALAPFTTEVVGGAPPKGGCGCTGGPPELASLWALAALALALRRRR